MNMPDNVAAVVAQQAIAFYLGESSSSEAYATIDVVIGSPWNYYTGVLNDTRRLFDAVVTFLIDFDVDTWATGDPDTAAFAYGLA